MITIELLIISVLLLLNAFFAMSEIAIVSASKPMLRQMAKQGNRRAALALQLAENSGRFLSTVQVGITLIGILAGAYGGAQIADKLAPVFDAYAFVHPHGELAAIVLVVAVLTYFSVVVGELIPKQLALSNAERLAMLVAGPMHGLSMAFTPVVVMLEYSADSFFRALRIRRGAEKVTEAEVKAVLAEGAASGAIEKAEHDMLNRIMRLGDRDVKSIMTHRVDITFIDVRDTMETIRQKVHQAGHSRFPVIAGDPNHVIGIVHAKELLDAALSTPGHIEIARHIKPAPILTENTKCLAALDLFKTASVHVAIVVDEYGATEGIVTASDLLEAIVGVIHSNYDSDDEPLIVQRADGSWLVEGTTPIDEIHLSIGIEEINAKGSFETIAGFLLHSLGRTPGVGEVLDRYGYRFEVVDLDGRRIDKVLITKLSDGPGDSRG